MSNNKYLIIYNICEIGKRNFEWYSKCINNLLKIVNFVPILNGLIIILDNQIYQKH